jgi:hypothetical protein
VTLPGHFTSPHSRDKEAVLVISDFVSSLAFPDTLEAGNYAAMILSTANWDSEFLKPPLSKRKCASLSI